MPQKFQVGYFDKQQGLRSPQYVKVPPVPSSRCRRCRFVNPHSFDGDGCHRCWSGSEISLPGFISVVTVLVACASMSATIKIRGGGCIGGVELQFSHHIVRCDTGINSFCG